MIMALSGTIWAHVPLPRVSLCGPIFNLPGELPLDTYATRKERQASMPGQWQDFYERQRRQRAGQDAIPSALLAACLLVVAYKVQGRTTSSWDWVLHALLTWTALSSAWLSFMSGHRLGQPERSTFYPRWRTAFAVVLRLGTASSNIMTTHAILSVKAELPATWPALFSYTSSLLLADYSMLLALLMLGWPLGIGFDLPLHAFCLWLVMKTNPTVCEAQGVHAGGSIQRANRAMGRLIKGRQRRDVCVRYTTILQVLVGFIVPSLFYLCHTTREAVLFAEDNRIPQSDRRLRVYRIISRFLDCIRMATYLSAGVGIGLAATWVLTSGS